MSHRMSVALIEKEEETRMTVRSITCPKCGRTSYNPNDVEQGYCGFCHDWTGEKGMTLQDIEQNQLIITDASGDTRIMWDPRNRDEVATAEAAFDAAKAKGMLAFAVDSETGERTGEVIRKFDKKAGKIIMIRQPAGG